MKNKVHIKLDLSETVEVELIPGKVADKEPIEVPKKKSEEDNDKSERVG
ncbi:MAG: hypothetical protein H8D23_06625 [Candidatus Brocadiales bacterium]|nr:hypothetical protein [Candidatus Brocadiales bacterium]